jgi:hypothetical protein
MANFYQKIKHVRQENNKNFKSIDLLFENIRNPFFILFTVIHVIYFIVIIGLFSINIEYVEIFNRYINYVGQIFISFYLLFRFNPFREYHCNPNDSIVIFWSSLFLLFNLGVINYIEDLLLKNPSINKTYNQVKDTYDKHLTQTSDYLKEKRQNLFNFTTNSDGRSPENSKNTK